MHRKPLAAFAAGLSVLAVAGIAFAHGGAPSSIQSTSATFDAGTVSDLKSDSCTGADGTYVRTRAKYTGTATSSDARLNGPLVVRASTVYNTTTNLGVVDGRYRVTTASGHTDGHFRAVDTNGSLAGFADGRSKANDVHANLLANVSATFDPTTGFSQGKLGDGSSTDTAVFVSGRCRRGPSGASGPSGPSGASGATGKAGAVSRHDEHGSHRRHGKHGRRH
jgi:hypothetical protein